MNILRVYCGRLLTPLTLTALSAGSVLSAVTDIGDRREFFPTTCALAGIPAEATGGIIPQMEG